MLKIGLILDYFQSKYQGFSIYGPEALGGFT